MVGYGFEQAAGRLASARDWHQASTSELSQATARAPIFTLGGKALF